MKNKEMMQMSHVYFDISKGLAKIQKISYMYIYIIKINFFFVLFMLPNILLSVTLKTWKLVHFRYFINVKCTIKHYSGNKIMLHICV